MLYSHSSFTMMHKATQVLARPREAATRYIQRIPSIYHAIVKNAKPKLQTAQEHLIHIKQNTGKYITSASKIARTIISNTCRNTASYLKKNPQILYATGAGIAALCALKLIRTPLGRHTTHTVKESCINTCLHSGNLTLIKYALKIAPDKINHTNQFGQTILHQAAKHNRLDIVEFLLNNYTDTINISALDHAQYEPIHYAAAYGSIALIKCFIQTGKAINTPTNQGLTPLHIAASCGRLDMAHYLVQHGANIHATTTSGKKAMDLAAQNKHYDVARYLSQLMDTRQHRHYEHLLDSAITKRNFSDAHVALDGDASMIRPNLEDTPLFRCIGEYNARQATALDTIAKLLLERGAPLHYIDDATGNNRLLERALEQGNVRIARLLFQHDITASAEQCTRYAQLREQTALAPTR